MFFFRIELSSFDDEKKSLFIVPDIQDADENGVPVFSEKTLTAHADFKQFIKDTKTSIVDVKYALYKADTANEINEEIFAELLSANNLELMDSNEFPITSGKSKGKSGGKDNTKMYLIIGIAALAFIVLIIVSAAVTKAPDNGDIGTTDSSSEISEISDSSEISDNSENSDSSDTSSETSENSDNSSDYVDVPPDNTSSNMTDEPPQDTNSSGYTDGGYSSGGNYGGGSSAQSEYTITFHSNGGEGEIAEIISAPGQYVVLPSAEEASKSLIRKGYKLIGFSDNVEINYPLYDYKMPSKDIMLFAVWEADEFTVNYNSNGGTGQLSSAKVKFGEEIPLPTDIAVYRDEMYLIGWSTDSKAKSALKNMKMPAESVTLYAVWSNKKPTAKVTFHYDDSVMVREEEIGSALNLRQDFGIIKDGYIISGWYLQDDPDPINYLQISGNCDVYGQWDRATYITISIDQGYLNKSPLTYRVPLDMDGNATLNLPKINDRSSAYNSVYGCTYGYSSRKPSGEFGTIEYYGDTECKFRKDTTLYRVLNRYGGGDGSERNPYIIDYYDQLLYLAENGASGYFKQTADIKFPDNVNRKPINTVKVSRGYEDKSYNLFVYDGQNYSIKNLRGNGGLFGTLAASTIKNVYIDGASISSDFENSGILVNEITSYSFDAINGSETYSTGNSQIQNCRAANSAIYTDGTVKNVGGICGYGGSIESCTADNISIRGGEAAGCIVGNACTVKGCLSRGNSIEGGAEISGGIAGTAFGVELHERGDRVRKVGGEITGCGVVSFASTNADYCGGVAGLTSGISYDSYIRGCYAANIYLNGKQNGSISGGDSDNAYPHTISYCVVDNTNKYAAIGGKYPRSGAARMVISVPADGIKVEGVLSVLNSPGSGYDKWQIDKNVNNGYPYQSDIM